MSLTRFYYNIYKEVCTLEFILLNVIELFFKKELNSSLVEKMAYYVNITFTELSFKILRF